MKSRRYLPLICLLLVAVFCLSACNPDYTPAPTPIKHGFSKDLVALLKDEYEIEIPTSAVFVDGNYDNGFQDDAIHITFKIPSDMAISFYSEHWKPTAVGSVDIDRKGFERIVEYERKSYTFLCFYKPAEDGTVEVYFLGRWPEKHIT
jgi:hypothetical protein